VRSSSGSEGACVKQGARGKRWEVAAELVRGSEAARDAAQWRIRYAANSAACSDSPAACRGTSCACSRRGGVKRRCSQPRRVQRDQLRLALRKLALVA
jgi:hypothetical protein